ncbi:MAG: NYN domain-containing protein [Verrucomicrobiae bacterium]|nr:NYN domain-containing protein [Verrucomicrobiae bacterium]
MPVARILVDGYSLLHRWQAVAPGQPPHSEAARDRLVRWLTRYHDATGVPISVFFDGSGAAPGVSDSSTPEVEVLFSRAGKTADEMIERAAHRLLEYGEVWVVTDDSAEQQTVTALGAIAISCSNFIRMVEDAVAQLHCRVKRINKAGVSKFNQPKIK